MLLRRFYISFFFLLYSVALVADPLVVQLQPPYVDDADLLVPAACNRPRRSAGINISLEKRDDKTIVHCYGHGGSGYTTLFGSIDQAFELLCEAVPSFDTPIRVIGSGCMGLTLAIDLRRAGYSSISISTKQRHDLPSWRAGGFFDPGVGTESSPEELHELNLGLATYKVLHTIEEGAHPYLPRTLVNRMPIYYPCSINCGVEILEKLNLMPASELVTLDFGNGVIHEGYKRQMTYFIDVTALMKELWIMVEALQIPVADEEISSFADCSESVICNCTGLGSRILNNDAAVYPGRGHFYMLKAQADGAQLDYMLFTKVGEKKEWIYFFPKPAFMSAYGEIVSGGMLGGTSIPCTDMTETELASLDVEQFERLKTRCSAFFFKRT